MGNALVELQAEALLPVSMTAPVFKGLKIWFSWYYGNVGKNDLKKSRPGQKGP